MSKDLVEAPRSEIDPFSERFLNDPYSFYAEIREVAPVFYISKYNVFGAARYGEVTQALSDHETYCSRRGVGIEDFNKVPCWRGEPSRILEVDPPVHTKNRAIMNAVLNVNTVRNLKETWREKARLLVRELADREQFDGVTDLANVFPLSVFPDAVGIQQEGRENLLPYGNLGFNAFGPDNELRRNAFAAAKPIMDWVADSLKRENLAEDGLGQAIYAFADTGEISEKEASLLVRSLLAAGLDTTVNSIAALIYCIALHSDEFQKLKNDKSLLKPAFEEVLRWISPAQTFFRTTSKETVLGGITIPEGAKLLLFLGSANRDPRHWDDGDRFDVSRRPVGHVAFGHGIHACVGQMIARAETELVLEAMIDFFETISLSGEPRFKLNNTLRSFERIPVCATN